MTIANYLKSILSCIHAHVLSGDSYSQDDEQYYTH